jgi:hypothetical protein
VPVSYVMCEGMQLTFRARSDNLDLGWTTNDCCILRSLVLDERELDDTGIGDVWQLNFKPIGLIVSPHDINIYDYGPICEDIQKMLFRYFNIRNRNSRFTYVFTVTFEYSKDT